MDDNIDREKVFYVIAEGCQSDSQRELVKKYMPQIRANNKCKTEWAVKTNNIAKAFCKWAKWTSEEYRRFKSTGKAHEFQKYISTGQYDKLEWGKISGKALLNLATSKFLDNHDLADSYLSWISTTPTAKFNGYPYELGMKMRTLYNNNSTSGKVAKMTIDAQFENLLKTAKQGTSGISGNVWCALDTSGSMGTRITRDSELSAYDVCISLGVYFSSLNEGAFHKNVIMFDDKSYAMQLSGTFSEMYKQIACSSTAWGGTNFQSIINEIIRIRKTHPNIPLTDYPTTLLVVSDMQFNKCANYTNYEKMKEKLYTVFPKDFVDSMKFIWWQVNGARTNDVPATLDEGGCYFISGFDGSIVTLLLGFDNTENKGTKNITMQDFVDKALSQEILQLVKF